MFETERGQNPKNPPPSQPTPPTLPDPGPENYVTRTPTPLPPADVKVIVPRHDTWVSKERNGGSDR